MKAAFSTHWKASTQPRKQRKYRYEAPLHIKGSFLSAALSKTLQKKHEQRSARVCVGDKVRIVRGQFAKKQGKVEKVDVKTSKVYITGVEGTKKEGTKLLYPVHASNVIIEEVKTDKKRFQKQKPTPKKETKAE